MDEPARKPSLRQDTGGGITPSGRLVAKRLDAGNIGTDEAIFSERAEVVKRSGGRATGIRVADDSDMRISADLMDDGSTVMELSGPVPQGEATVARVCQVLIRLLNQAGSNWSPPKNLAASHGRDEQGVDCVATDGDRTLLIQVARAESRPGLWRALARLKRILGRYDADELAANLHHAINKKSSRIPHAQRSKITLALDAMHTVGYSLDPAVDRFRELHGSWARSLGYAGIWVVGIDTDLTHRLD